MPPKKRTIDELNNGSPGSACIVEDLLCSICLRMAVHAVQSACCGNLHCRSCIAVWLASNSTCPCCRDRLRSDSVLPDIRAERRSAAALRPCSYINHGCRFEGNRAAMADHEIMCAFVPQEARERHIFKLLRTSENLVDAAFGPNPSIQVLKIMYGIPSNEVVLQIKRIRQQLIEACHLKVADATFALEFDESNYNVGVYLRKFFAAEAPCDIKVTLLHPKQTVLATDFVFSQELTSSTTPGKAKGFHAMRSSAFDGYCVRGSFFVAIAGAVVQ